MIRARRDENGIALVAAMLVMVVCVILVIAGLQLAVHTTQRSALDRNKTAALHAAQAGIEAQLSSLALNNCPTATAAGPDVTLPDQVLPTESYRILAATCTASTAVIAAVGYVPSSTNPAATATVVAHVDRNQNAPVSGGVGNTTSPYIFPDALFSGGPITATGLNTYGIGGTVPNIAGNGPISIAGNQIDGAVHGWGPVTLTASQIDGDIQSWGGGVTVNNATVQPGTSSLITQTITTSGPVALVGSTVNGAITYGTGTAPPAAGSTVTGSVQQHNFIASELPLARQMPSFSYNLGDIQALPGLSGVGATPGCPPPANATGIYHITTNVACSWTPTTPVNGTVVIVVSGGTLNVTVPQTTTGGQLYIINAGGPLPATDAITLNGSDSTLPVFAYADGPMTLNGSFTGQVIAGSITTTSSTITFQPPVTTFPDFSFSSQTTPGSTGLAATVQYEYQCPGVTAC